MSSPTNAKEKLVAELRKDDPSATLVLELAAEVAAADPDFVRFTIDASHISKVGLELVAKQETAVAELVKNAYDADATEVELVFKAAEAAGGVLEVWDNGNGMSREELVDGFMRISTQEKVTKPHSPRFHRQRAGQKGIGRFAAQRLGTKLTIMTETPGAVGALLVEIDWEEFAANRELTHVPVRMKSISPLPRKGTVLRIENLRDAWSDARIQRAHRHVSGLIQPFPLCPQDDGPNTDPGFAVYCFRETRDDLEVVADEWTLYFKHALAEITASVDAEGHASWSYTCDRLGLEEDGIPIAPDRAFTDKAWQNLRGVDLKAYYYIHDDLPKIARSNVRAKLKESGGIRLYRNGFRVLPYGASYDDWLKLDATSRQRSFLPPFANVNFLGFVSVTDPSGERFQETSSREGLVENDAFEELRGFVDVVLRSAVTRVAEARGRKVQASKPPVRRDKPVSVARDIADRVRRLGSEIGAQPADSAGAEKLAAEILELGRETEELANELAMTRVLASLGLSIGEFTHEVMHGFGALASDTAMLEGIVGADDEGARSVRRLREVLDSLRSYVSYFDETARENVSRELKVLEVRDILRHFVDVVEPQLQRLRITLDGPHFDGGELFVRPMHPSEWSSVLLNLFTNSAKAIQRADASGRLRVSARRHGDAVIVDFADNGDGVDPENADRIFDAFFTTTGPAGPLTRDSDQLTGMGLGLRITRDIVEGAGGTIRLSDAPEGYTTCFTISVPAANEEEIPDDAY